MITRHPFCSRRRAAITLLEVMISIGVVGIGLLGVASLIPLAHYKANQGVEEDRKSLFGKRAFREFFVQGMDRPGMWQVKGGLSALTPKTPHVLSPYWVWVETTPDPLYTNVYYDDTKGTVRSGQSFCLDPLWVATHAGTGISKNARFPVDLASPTVPIPPPRYFPMRLTLMAGRPEDVRSRLPNQAQRLAFDNQIASKNPPVMSVAQADDIFRSHDDLEFLKPKGTGQILRQNYLNGVDKRYAYGAYSWMATLSPDEGPGLGLYTLSIVIFRQRSLAVVPRQEIICQVDPVNSMMIEGTREIAIRQLSPVTDDNDTRVNDIKSGSWIALIQIDANGQYNAMGQPNLPNLPNNVLNQIKWYRVVSADESTGTSDPDRLLSLAGPDWSPAADPRLPIFAIFAKNVVAVYDKTVELR